MGSGMMFIELRRTRILTEGNSQFYTQPEVGHVNGGWFLPSLPVVPSEFASGSFRVCQYSSSHMYVGCHVTKSNVQAGAVTTMQ
jgi:hypothetical protein